MPPATSATAKLNSNARYEDRGVEERPTTNAASQTALLTALRNMIITLVQAAVPNSKGLDDVPMGREAEDLLASLQTYISSVIRDETKTRVVDLAEMSEQPGGPNMGSGRVNLLSAGTVNAGKILEKSNDEPEELVIFRTWKGIDGEITPLKDVLTNLREHVFNRLPIRLLSFRKSDLDNSKLEISLLERGEIYAHLVRNLRKHLVTRHIQFPAAYVVSDKYDPILASNYAILSHTWLQSSPEVTYNNWMNGDDLDLSHEGYRKLVNFCCIAEAEDAVTFGWMDTVCIDKSSSSELDESIRSMYKWYENAKICITYLADTSSINDMATDRWFTRGWTLQELIAPKRLNFYSRDWKRVKSNATHNDKKITEIQEIIFNATGIARHHIENLGFASIPTKMQWAAKRQVTRSEDASYSLMGLFGVNMSIAYGEGPKRAFARLVNEIINATPDKDILDIFDFGVGPGAFDGIFHEFLPSNPKAYLDSSNFNFSRGQLTKPLVMTHLGLRIPVLLLQAAPGSSSSKKYTSIGDYFAHPVEYTDYGGRKYLNILDISWQDKPLVKNVSFYGPSQHRVAVLNCTAAEGIADIRIPAVCLAAILIYDPEVQEQINSTTRMEKLSTKAPVVFELQNHIKQPDWSRGFYTIPRSELARHGMQFLTMYL
ncbi:hypothetical protein BDN70DRAFT_867329 [Pholiota conissans]|uniref:Heterokaryon incompatibility domain-containing protein n=1 Tax=Pholiota conissans TaxID=109636 RepID=A0A9P5YTH3_9AGAR|nr:hypothetical protein BDN70DRAFT_867329 [Pholiota conissans]